MRSFGCNHFAYSVLFVLVLLPLSASAQEEPNTEKGTPATQESAVEEAAPQNSASGDDAEPGLDAGVAEDPEKIVWVVEGESDEDQGGNPDTEKRLEAIEQVLKDLAAELKSSKSVEKPDETASKSAVSDEAGRPSRPDPRLALPPKTKLDAGWLEELNWRSIGPANMSGRITDIAVHEQDTSLWWIATASGGLLKTTNHGGSMEYMFDREKVVSIGSIATDPNNKDVLWVGTGEINPRNSVSYGNGVYKTTDGGKTFEHMGLDKSYQIARILVDPTDSNVVYVGAAGRLYGTNRERGVYKTTDGGKSWEQVLYVDDRAGVIDMAMHPENPKIIVAALWDRLRDGFDSWPGNEPKPEGVDGYDPIRKWGPGGGLYRTEDAGQTWTKLTDGLPPGMTGRIGLDWQSKSPHSLVAIIDCEDIGKGPKPFTAFLGVVGENVDGKPMISQIMPDSPAAKAGFEVGDKLKSVDGQSLTHFDELLDILRKKKINDRVTIEVERGEWTKGFNILLTGRPGTNQSEAVIFLGVVGADLEGKIVLQQITKGASAENAGLKAGDVVTSVDGEAPANFEAMMDELRKKSDGDQVKLGIQRGEESLEVAVTLEARVVGRSQTPAQSNVYMGIRGENGTEGGAVLTEVTEEGPAEKAGLKAKDVIKQVDGKDVADYEAFIQEIRARQPEDKMKVKVQRGEESLDLEVVLGDRLSGSSSSRPYTYSYFGQQPNVQDQQGADGYKYGGVYKSTDGGVTWKRINSLNTRPMYFSVVKVDPQDDQNLYVLGVSQTQSTNGGVTFTSDFGRRVHADGHDLWINPTDGRHMIIGCDGGIYVTFDRGQTWDHINTVAIGQFYHVAISPKEPYWVAGGLQDNGSWAGPAIDRSGGAVNEDWLSINGGDGFVCRVDPDDPDLFYAESQNGAIVRRHLRTGERASIRPPRVEGKSYRFNWNTPFILSSHNPKIFYSAGNYVFRSLDRGDDLQAISPEITLTQRGSATALSESPMDSNVLYAGTDDGALWVTRDGGYNWDNITGSLGIPNPRWVATIEASKHAAGRVYVCLDGHRSDDDEPYIFVSEDYGKTFKPLHEGLPWGSTRCLREDISNPNLLYLGTEFAFWISVDRGQSWTQFNQKLPTVAIHEVAIHPTNGEIVLATHGRSLWACDITPLRQLKPENVANKVAFFDPQEVVRWRRDPSRGGTNRSFSGQNPGSGASLWYVLPEKVERVVARIEDIEGNVISELNGNVEPGIHSVSWNLTATPQRPNRDQPAATGGRGSQSQGSRPAASGRGAGGRGRGQAAAQEGQEETAGKDEQGDKKPESKEAESSENESNEPEEQSETEEASAENETQQSSARPPQGFRGFRGARPVPNGTYRVQLQVDGKVVATKLVSVVRDPGLPENAVADELYELQLLLDQQAKEDKFQNKSNGRGHYTDD